MRNTIYIAPDTQNIAVLIWDIGTSVKDSIPPIAIISRVRGMKYVLTDSVAVSNMAVGVLWKRNIYLHAARRAIYDANIPNVSPSRASSPKPSMKSGQYILNRKAVRTNGMHIDAARRFLSVRVLRLCWRFTFSFHLAMQEVNDGKMPTSRFSSTMTKRSETSARISKSMSVPSFYSVTHIFQQGDDPVAEIALDCYFSVFCTASHSSFYLECAS